MNGSKNCILPSFSSPIALPPPSRIVPPKKAYFGSANGVNLSSKLISDGSKSVAQKA